MEKIVTDPAEKQWGLFAHLAAFAAFVIPVGNIIGPLIVYLIKKDEYPYVADQAREVLNFQITWSLLFFVSAILIIVIVGIFMLIGFGIAWLILMIIGSVHASNGEWFRYPLSIRFIK